MHPDHFVELWVVYVGRGQLEENNLHFIIYIGAPEHQLYVCPPSVLCSISHSCIITSLLE